MEVKSGKTLSTLLWGLAKNMMEKVKEALQKIKELVTKNMINNKNSYIWYVGYGSNLSKQRFLCYIKGGKPTYGQKTDKGCSDKTVLTKDQPYKIPYRLYFALADDLKKTDNWGLGGVAFISTDKEENSENWTLGRMWKITRKQYEEVRNQEGRTWYNEEIHLGEEDGIPIYAITSKNKLSNILPPSDAYLKTIALGLKETCNLTTEEITEYLITKEGVKGKLTKDELISKF